MLLGLPATDHHLEFTQHDDGSPGAAPSRDNLLVLSFDDRAQVEQVLTRLASLGHLPVTGYLAGTFTAVGHPRRYR